VCSSPDTFVLQCSCLTIEKGFIFSWFRTVNHTDSCRAFRRAYPMYVEPVRHPPTENMNMSATDYDRLKAIEPVAAWRWKWKQPMDAWKYVLFPRV